MVDGGDEGVAGDEGLAGDEGVPADEGIAEKGEGDGAGDSSEVVVVVESVERRTVPGRIPMRVVVVDGEGDDDVELGVVLPSVCKEPGAAVDVGDCSEASNEFGRPAAAPLTAIPLLTIPPTTKRAISAL